MEFDPGLEMTMARFKDNEVTAVAREALINKPDFFREIIEVVAQRLLEEVNRPGFGRGSFLPRLERMGHGKQVRFRDARTCSQAF